MHPTRLAVLLLAGIGLSACVGVHDGYYQQPYGTFTGSTNLATPYVYPSGSRPYLYNQSQASWPRTYNQRYQRQYQEQYRRQNQGNYRNRHNRPDHGNRRNF